MSTNTLSSVLLATAQVRVKSLHQEYITLRALIDQGSQITSISEEAAQILQLPRKKTEVKLQGLGQTVVGVAKAKINLEIHPRFLSNEMITAEALILPKLVATHPDVSFNYDVQKWKNFNLADPNFNKADRIDIVIGADLFSQILEDGVHREEKILGQNTKLGWILSGVIRVNHKSNTKSVATTNIERFWEIEEIEEENSQDEEDKCLKLYSETTRRDEDGKFIVRIPFLEDCELGDSYKRAMARLMSLERRLKENPLLKNEYCKIMEELLSMGHMKKVDPSCNGKYYLPHQAVVRESSLTTKVRVVFDASSKTTNGKSLNDILQVGPKLQKDIFDIITKWRSWKYVISSDVEKMFRQIKIDTPDQEYQYVLWRKNPSNPIEQYKLTTVTYGTSSAPFLAIRTLIEIANHCKDEDISSRIKEDFYMDDLLTGADTIQDCMKIREAISNHLDKFGFHLRKWISNNGQIIKTDNFENNEVLNIQEDACLKTLGLQWNPKTDNFTFNMQIEDDLKITKRIVLSRIARIFDPLGWLTPITVTAKLFIQHLWKLQSDWDEPLDKDLSKTWKSFVQNLPALTNIKINRWIQRSNGTPLQLHGFADASEKAYAAVVYAKVGSTITIVAAKSKVNPIKNKKTLPKLELCAAHLLARLLHKIKYKINAGADIYAWSDSMITLSWIRKPNSKEKFIRTRVSEINQCLPNVKWGYVKSKENPADIGSRGINPEKLESCSLWWCGPEWLKKDKNNWPSEEPDVKEDEKNICLRD
ncbi:uncharacterized protein LOC135950662 [Calliphora vicina]|uniref:uncharacterized protein LOC135950662 n=1 Tax=Calliphora vicina TaxID=7373 RepID=UPI00325A950B